MIPADDKPFARVVAAAVLAHTLIEIDPKYPVVSKEARDALQTTKTELEGQAAPGTAPDPIERELAEKAPNKSKGAGKPKSGKGKKS